jgi:hypothetical protein
VLVDGDRASTQCTNFPLVDVEEVNEAPGSGGGILDSLMTAWNS